MMPLTMAKTGQNVENADASMLAAIGGAICWIFTPLGFGNWQAAVTTLTGLTAYSFMIFNLLCAPCFAAMGAIKREMNNAKWTWAAIGYMCLWAYVLALIVYQIGGLIAGQVAFGLGTIAALACVAGILTLLLRKNPNVSAQHRAARSVSAK